MRHPGAVHNYYCSCGAVLKGNAAKASHRRGHEARGELRHQRPDGWHSVNLEQWEALARPIAPLREVP